MVERDAPFILELLNEPAFIEYIADRHVRTLADAATYIRDKFQPSYLTHGFGFYLVELRPGNVPIGMCGLVKREALDDVDVGYAFLQRHGRKGYAFEAARAVLEFGRAAYGLQRIVAITSPGNHGSAKLLEKLGLRFERTIQMPGFAQESRLYGQAPEASPLAK